MTCYLGMYKAGKTQQGWIYGNFHAEEMSRSKCDDSVMGRWQGMNSFEDGKGWGLAPDETFVLLYK